MKKFDSLGLSEALLRAVREKGYTQASPIQAKAIPAVLAGKDVLAAAQTGTGKTAGFTLPLLQKMSTQNQKGGPRPIKALVITPTRELAAQVQESVKAYGKFLSLRSAVVFGGVSIQPQKNILRKGVDILVATPGRLLDLANQKVVDLGKVNFLVLDEADRMLDMGFIHDIRKVLALLPSQRQNLLFSATFSDDIRKLAKGFMQNPVSIDVAPRNTTAETVAQRIYKVDRKRKPALLKHLIKSDDWKQVLVFTRTKYGANRLAKKLDRSGIQSMAIHGNKSQGARTKALQAFKNGEVRVLVATDIAARGLDIEQLPWVVNFDLPNVAEDYVHRIGRTGRAGMTGQAISLVSDEEQKQLHGIERLLGKRLPSDTVDGFEPGVEPEDTGQRQAAPSQNGHQNRKSKSLPNRRQQKKKPAQQKAEAKSNEQKPTSDQTNKKRPAKAEQKGKPLPNNKESHKRKQQSKKSKRRKSNHKSNEQSDSKSVPFSKAYKKRKPGTKGPIGYGMFPLE